MNKIYKRFYRLGLIILVLGILPSCEEEETFIAPTADFEITGVLKAYDTLTFTNNSKNATSFLWHFGNGETVYSRAPKYVYTTPGTYSISLQAEGAGGRNVVTKDITIAEGVPLPTAMFSIQNEGVLLESAPVVFENESLFGAGYLWEFGDSENSTSNEKDPIFTYTTPGNYTVKLTVTNEKGSDEYSMNLVVQEGNLGFIYFIHNDLSEDKFYVKKVNARSFDVSTVTEIPGFGFGIEYDPVNEMIYYSDDDNLKIYRNNLQGSDETEIASGFSSVRDLALDWEFGYLYVTDRSADALVEIRLSDFRISTLYDNANDDLGALPVGVDYSADQLYITCVDIDAESVWKGNVFGDGITRIIDYNAGGYGYGIAVDEVNSKIYFDDYDTGNLLRANLDGTDVETIVSTSDRTYGIEIDTEFNKLYWSERNGNVYVSNLDGTGKQTLVSGLGDIRGIVLIK
jgi:PKD repeat protein